MLGRCITASPACLAGLSAFTPFAAAAALALVVTPSDFVAASVAVTVREVRAAPEALVGTAGLLGAAMDHAGRVVGQLAEGLGRGEHAECRLVLLLLSGSPRVLAVPLI